MAGVFDDVTFEELEVTDPDHPRMVLFADPFLCPSVPTSDPAPLCNLRLTGAEDLIFSGNALLEEDQEDLLLSAVIAMHDHGLPNDPAPVVQETKDLNECTAAGSTKERKENRKRKLQAGVGSAPARYRPTSRNAARERSRVKSLRLAFLELQNSLPSVPANTKLSKLDVLVLATTYIAHLMKILNDGGDPQMAAFEDSNQLTMATAAATPNTCFSGVGSGERHHRLHEKGYLHPVRKWPMRSRLYAGVFEEIARGPSSGSAIHVPALALPDINYSMPLLDANLNVLFAFKSENTMDMSTCDVQGSSIFSD